MEEEKICFFFFFWWQRRKPSSSSCKNNNVTGPSTSDSPGPHFITRTECLAAIRHHKKKLITEHFFVCMSWRLALDSIPLNNLITSPCAHPLKPYWLYHSTISCMLFLFSIAVLAIPASEFHVFCHSSSVLFHYVTPLNRNYEAKWIFFPTENWHIIF